MWLHVLIYLRKSCESPRRFLESFNNAGEGYENSAKDRRQRAAQDLLDLWWSSYFTRQDHRFNRKIVLPNRGIVLPHLDIIEKLLKSRFSVFSGLLAPREFSWGSGMEMSYLISDSLAYFSHLARASAYLPQSMAWPLQVDLYDYAEELIENLKGAADEAFRSGVEKVLIPAFPLQSPMAHLLRARLFVHEASPGDGEEKKRRLYQKALKPAKEATSIVLAALEEFENPAKWSTRQWYNVKRSFDLHYDILIYLRDSKALYELAETIDYILDGSFGGVEEESEIYERYRDFIDDYRLLAAMMRVQSMKFSKNGFFSLESLEEKDLKRLRHARDNEELYDTGRREAALVLLRQAK